MSGPRHLIFTRYNIPLAFPGRRDDFSPLDDAWLDKREEMFRRYCLPSLEAQSDQRFAWLLFFHPKTPEARYRLLTNRGVVCFARSHAEIVAGLQEYVREHKGVVITTRLDSDDALARDFVARTRSFARRTAEHPKALGMPHALAFRHGIERDTATDAVYRRDYPYNGYTSLIELVGDDQPIRTALCCAHYDLSREFTTTIAGSDHPMWAITVHGENIANAVKGDLIEDDAEREAALAAFGQAAHLS